MLKANCTTTAFAEDKSNYWEPALYYINPDGTYSLMTPTNVVVYYTSKFKNSVPFPEGLRMVVGNAMKRDQGAERFQGVQLNWDEKASQGESFTQFPTKSAPQGWITTRLFFPSCGLASQDLDSDDHFSHMAYPVHGGNYWATNARQCPDTHPIAYPSIQLETFYKLTDEQKANWRNGGTNLVWSNGDTRGDTLHGDFVNGWDSKVLQHAIDKQMEAFADPVDRIFGQDGATQYRAAQQCLMEVRSA